MIRRLPSKKVLARRRRNAAKAVLILKKLFPKIHIALNWNNPWQLLVAVILSAQCTDKKVNEVTRDLFKKYPTLDDYVNTTRKEFEKDIHSTGFYRNKAKNILATAKIIKDTYGGKVPRTMEELILLPGVARKTANVVLGSAYGISVGIAVDTHVRRLSRKLGFTIHSNPDKIEQDLMEIIPKKDWLDFNLRLVSYGRAYCPAKSHDHDSCPLRNIS